MLTLEEAQDVLEIHREPIFTAPLVAAVASWHRFVKEQPEMALPIDSSTRANMIHAWWREAVRRALGADGIREIKALEFFAVAVGTSPLVRFKLVNGGAPSNVMTDRQKLLARHIYDEDDMAALSAEGIPAPPTTLTCGYTLDDASLLRSIEIRCDHNRELMWRWLIWGDSAEGGGTIEPLPIPTLPTPQPARITSTRKRAKPDVIQAENES
ncbi:MAG: hypothetical protein JWM93_2980 [Frankiales bacterium]|nr:hypothetical protein [Frankiales bacterium]